MKKSLYIITGCSKGLGKALMDKLIQTPGNQVVGISRSEMDENENFLHISLDLGSTESLISSLNKIFPSGEFEKIALINNAGWIGEIAPLGKLDPNGIQLIHATNLIAPAILMNEFVQQYGASKAERVVINISSGAASKAIDGWSGYCSSKAALNQLTLVAEEESKLKSLGIKYYALSPGIIDTAMQEDIRSSSQENFSNRDRFRSYQRNGDLSSPEETAAKVLYMIANFRNFEEVLQDVREF
ncbi:MAG: SDR family NAD(P)-dependent oxidoreductase [Anditalea sp.]